MMRTKRNRGGAWPLAVARALAGVLALSLAQPSEAAAQSECAENIAGPNGSAGTLVGSQTVTYYVRLWIWRIPLSREAGTYALDDGSIVHVWCD